MTDIDMISQYPNKEILINQCSSFEEQDISLTATFMGKTFAICNCNAVGDILEEIF